MSEPIMPPEMQEEYRLWKAAKEQRELEEECPHDEHDHGICLNCGKDVLDTLIDRAEMMRDE